MLNSSKFSRNIAVSVQQSVSRLQGAGPKAVPKDSASLNVLVIDFAHDHSKLCCYSVGGPTPKALGCKKSTARPGDFAEMQEIGFFLLFFSGAELEEVKEGRKTEERERYGLLRQEQGAEGEEEEEEEEGTTEEVLSTAREWHGETRWLEGFEGGGAKGGWSTWNSYRERGATVCMRFAGRDSAAPVSPANGSREKWP